MNCSRTSGASTILTKQSAASVLKAINGNVAATSASRPAFILLQRQCVEPRRQFSTTRKTQFSRSNNLLWKEVFPAKEESEHIHKTPAAWPHPMYTDEQMHAVVVAHREAKTFSDKVAMTMVRILRWGLDLATGYKHSHAVKLNEKDPQAAMNKYGMTERKYMIRNIFLESVAGVPGMVGGMLRHLHSMRRMKRDNGWIETLLEESYNERMHLLTFLKMAEPGWFMRVMVLGAQGVFFNAMFVSYLISPKTCHRFVGYLEEEAVLTYTREIEDIDAGKLPKWEKMQAPDIAVQYWNMPEGHRTMRDLLLYIRADESKHREVNHTLGNLDQHNDPNPYVSSYKEPGKPHPTKGIEYPRPSGWEREEII
ncbi:inducible alternative oxidase 2 [Vermiconidia calcicola]|uniref:Inducible alternative oxidase 2 n=1 Tax=Vermiconidia calcicola TaxID=1690605 RepID=A0ACC3NWJ4_9PEZI|nr:inducible alternative oxidase 2 [Vermiconidia calcicola]